MELRAGTFLGDLEQGGVEQEEEVEDAESLGPTGCFVEVEKSVWHHY